MTRKPAAEQPDAVTLIRSEAFRLFGRFGYEGVSVGDIAKAARVSKSALYWHFRGKDDLYADCLRQLHALFDHYIFDPMRAAAQLFIGLARLLQDRRVRHGVAGYWMTPSRLDGEALSQTQRSFENRAVDVIRELLRRGEAEGRFQFGKDLDSMARAMISVVEAAVLPLRHLSPAEVHENLGILARTLFRAYASERDLAAFERAFD